MEPREATATTCGCRTGCANRRCSCFKTGQPCGDSCTCSDCDNPFNQLGDVTLSTCAQAHVTHVVTLTEDQLDGMHPFPCGHTAAPLVELLDDFMCPECGEDYWYSFCWGSVEQDSTTWHCERCGTCRDWREWHCENCDRCSYGVTLPCEGCGAEGPMADLA